jgi:hypothetical protein
VSRERWRAKFDAWLHAWREWYPTIPVRLNDWAHQVRAEPTLFFRTPAVQAVGIGLGVVVVVLLVHGLIGSIVPTPKDATPPAQYASFHLRCTNPDCGRTFRDQLEIDYHRWPMKCPYCQQKTVYDLRRCPHCRDWVIPKAENKQRLCPQCDKPI